MLSNATNKPKLTVELGYMCPQGLTGPPAVTNTQRDIEEEKSRSMSQGKVAIKEIPSRSIPMQGIESVLINVIKIKLKRRG